MNAAASLPPPPPPPAPAPAANKDTFHPRNWWHNGVACRGAVVGAVLAILNLFQPWTPDFHGAGFDETHWEGNQQVRRSYGPKTFLGEGTAFSAGSQGWIPLIGMVVALYVCGRPRRSLGGVRWVPLWAGVIVFACMFDALKDWDKQNEAFLANFSSRPVVTAPSPMLAVLWLALIVAVSGGFFARKDASSSAVAAIS